MSLTTNGRVSSLGRTFSTRHHYNSVTGRILLGICLGDWDPLKPNVQHHLGDVPYSPETFCQETWVWSEWVVLRCSWGWKSLNSTAWIVASHKIGAVDLFPGFWHFKGSLMKRLERSQVGVVRAMASRGRVLRPSWLVLHSRWFLAVSWWLGHHQATLSLVRQEGWERSSSADVKGTGEGLLLMDQQKCWRSKSGPSAASPGSL